MRLHTANRRRRRAQQRAQHEARLLAIRRRLQAQRARWLASLPPEMQALVAWSDQAVPLILTEARRIGEALLATFRPVLVEIQRAVMALSPLVDQLEAQRQQRRRRLLVQEGALPEAERAQLRRRLLIEEGLLPPDRSEPQ